MTGEIGLPTLSGFATYAGPKFAIAAPEVSVRP